LQCLDRQKISPDDEHIILMSEDSAEMQRLAKDLLPASGRRHRLIQMIGPEPLAGAAGNATEQSRVPDANEWAFTQLGLRVIAGYAFGVAIDKSRLLSPQGRASQGEYLARAKKLGLMVFVYPVGPDDTIQEQTVPTAVSAELSTAPATDMSTKPPTEASAESSTQAPSEASMAAPPQPPVEEGASTQPPTEATAPAASSDAAPPVEKAAVVKASDFFLKTLGVDGLFMSPLSVPPTTDQATSDSADNAGTKSEVKK
jgi:hypothetical protein